MSKSLRVWACVGTVGLSLLSLGMVGGCNQSEEKKGDKQADKPASGSAGVDRVGVMDLDKVAEGLGWAAQFKANYIEAQKLSQQEADQTSARLEAQFQSMLHEMAPNLKKGDEFKPTKEQTTQLQQAAGTIQQQRQALMNAENQRLQQYAQEWRLQYRKAIEPVVRQIAEKRGLMTVLLKTEAVMYSHDSVDLTNAVIDAGRASPPPLAAVSLPTLPLDRLGLPGMVGMPGIPTTQTTQPSSTTKPSTP